MATELKQLEERRIELAQEIRELAKNEQQWTDDDKQKWISINEEYDQTVARVNELRQQNEVASRLAALEEQDDQSRWLRNSTVGEMRYARRNQPSLEDRALALQAWFLTGAELELRDEHRQACQLLRVNPNQRQFDFDLQCFNAPQGYQMWETARGPYTEVRDVEMRQGLDTGTAGAGGETIPEGFSYELERFLLAYGGPRRVCRIFQTASGNDIPWPTVDDTSNAAVILNEATDMGPSVDPTFAQVVLGAFKYSSQPVLISAELLQDSAFNMAQLLAELLGERIGRGQAVHFISGNGTTQPQGLEACNLGVTFASNSAITGDELIDLQGALDPAYEALPSIGWMMNKATVTAVRKLKGVDNDYIWQPGLRAMEPDLLLGKPYTVCQEVADIGSSAKSVFYGAFQKYVIRDAGMMRFYRLQELYRATDQEGFVAFRRTDGKLINPAAILHGIHPA